MTTKYMKLKDVFQFHFFAVILAMLSFSFMTSFVEANDNENEQILLQLGELTGPFVELGVPHHTTLAVSDLDAVKNQISAAIGVEFREVTEETRLVRLPGNGFHFITFRRVYSKPGSPFIEIVEANPPIGPWEATADSSSGYIGYAVDNVILQGLQLTNAGFTKIAQIHNKYAVYEAEAGVRIELVNNSLVPETGEPYTSQAPIDLGVIDHLGWAINGEHRETIRQKFSEGLGVNWQEEEVFPVVPFTFFEGTGATNPGVYPVTFISSLTVEPGPFLDLDTAIFNLDSCDCTPPKNPCKFLPFDSTPTTSVFQVGSWPVASFEEVPAVIAQWENAGLEPVMHIDLGQGAPIVGDYKGIGGIVYEFFVQH